MSELRTPSGLERRRPAAATDNCSCEYWFRAPTVDSERRRQLALTGWKRVTLLARLRRERQRVIRPP